MNHFSEFLQIGDKVILEESEEDFCLGIIEKIQISKYTGHKLFYIRPDWDTFGDKEKRVLALSGKLG